MDASHRRRPSRLFLVALAVSLGAHLAALPLLRAPGPARASVPAHPFALESRPPFRIDPTPPPPVHTPPPRVEHAPPRPNVRRAAITPPHARARSARAASEPRWSRSSRIADTPLAGDPSGVPLAGGGPATGAPIPLPDPETPAPTAAATPTPGCPKAPRDASVIDAVTPDRPALAAAQDPTGHVEVRVDLTSGGGVAQASLYRSSGNEQLDAAAIAAARQARYGPASDGCKPIGGSYIYTVDFTE